MKYLEVQNLLDNYGKTGVVSLESIDSGDVRVALGEVFKYLPQAVVISCQSAIDGYLAAMRDHKTGKAVSRNERDDDYLTMWGDMAEQFISIGEMDQGLAGLAAGSLMTVAEMLDYRD